MSYPNARKGFKKLFASEILQLFSVILAVVCSVLLVLSASSADSGDELRLGVMGIGILVFGGCTALLVIAAMILNVIGVIQTSKDESSFKAVIYVVIVGIAAAVAIAVFDIFLSDGNIALNNFLQVVSDMVNAITTILIIQGISNIAEKIGDAVVIKKGQFLFHLIICIALASIFMKAVMMCIPDAAASAAEIILQLITAVLSIVQYIVYLSFLGKASTMLKNQ